MSVTVYADVDYKGKSATLNAGRHKLDSSMNDCISSLRIPAGWTATLYEHADFTGDQVTLNADTRKVEGNLHDKASAIVVAEPGTKPDDIFSMENGDDWFYFEDTTTSD
ncbi:peptidase inhibitor family I36 protein [Streptomyces litmocidini]|uniref:peptidase inhibitor family I36 protein n=1 Tax=Streptomyces litmocidini TaxID=67318 RepID=UPI0036FDF39C